MTLDITQVMPEGGRPLIQSYGDMRFRVSGELIAGSILLFPSRAQSWPVAEIAGIDVGALAPAVEAAADLDILVIGCGTTFAAVPKGLRQALKDAGLTLEWMDTGAACRTFNILQSEERRAAAAILAVP